MLQLKHETTEEIKQIENSKRNTETLLHQEQVRMFKKFRIFKKNFRIKKKFRIRKNVQNFQKKNAQNFEKIVLNLQKKSSEF